MRGPLALPAVVLLILAALGVAVWLSRPRAAAAGGTAPHRAPVTAATRVCPPPASGGTRITVFAASGTSNQPPGQDQRRQDQRRQDQRGQGGRGGQPQGGARLAALGSPGPPLARMAQPGRLWLYPAGHAPGQNPGASGPAAKAPVAALADVAMARGLEVEETSRPQGAGGTITGVRCSEPGTDFWFAGPGQAAAGAIRLYLINPANQAAIVNVDVYTDSGPLQDSTETAIAIPPDGRLTRDIGKVTKGSRVVAMHVRTSAGRVVAAVQAGGAGAGGSWVPATRPPATAQVIPGLPPAGGGRSLVLADPGGTDAQVRVQAVTPNGEYEPAGSGGIDVPSGTAVSVGLPSLNGVPGALRVTANVPVAAGLMADGAYDAAAGPVREQAVASDNTAGHGYSAAVVLSAPGGTARVALATATAAGGPGRPGAAAGRMVTIPAGHSRSVPVAAPHGGSAGFAIVVTPTAGSAPVYAGRVLNTASGGQTIMPLVSAPAWVPVPAVASSLTAVMP